MVEKRFPTFEEVCDIVFPLMMIELFVIGNIIIIIILLSEFGVI